MVKTRKVDVVLNGENGEVVFQKLGFEVPEFWSDRAALIAANKYAMDNEFSVLQIIDRVVNQIYAWGLEQKYKIDKNFKQDLKDILVNQRAAFNSPVWFNIGADTGVNQASACFIVPVEDTMESILQHNTIEGLIFRGGSGAGCNVSKLRAEGEKLSNKGVSSGPLSFMKMWDATAGVIKSGGKNRRSSKLICMDVDHPDIMDFIECKKKEEEKAKALINKGVSIDEAYATVAFQNANHSIRASDAFMKAIENGLDKWALYNRRTKDPHSFVNPKDVLRKAAEVAWEIGDPGIQFDDAMNRDNPVPNTDSINSTNPCFAGDMQILTDEGYKTFESLEGTEPNIISPITREPVKSKVWCSGVKPVCEVSFHWKIGLNKIKCTEDHIFKLSDGSECAARDLRGKRIKPFYLPRNIEMSDALLAGYLQVRGGLEGLFSSSSQGIGVYFNGKEDNVPDILGVKAEDFGEDKHIWWSKYAHRAASAYKLSHENLSNRFLPDCICSGEVSNKEMNDFLCGIFSAEGSVVANTRIMVKITSEKAANQLKEVLKTFYGIESYIMEGTTNIRRWDNGEYKNIPVFELNIHRFEHLLIFAEKIGFIHGSKTEQLVYTIDERSPAVVKVAPLGEQKVYDFTEEVYHWGVVEGFVVHNCSEFSAIDNSSCNLCSLNLMKYWNKELLSFDWGLFKSDISILITSMDILVDAADYPTSEIAEVTKRTRPLGLGFTNLGALLMVRGFPYGSEPARAFAGEITRKMTLYAYEKSIELATQLGSFAEFSKNIDENVELAKRLTEAYLPIKEKGLRNSQVTLLAPCGTISFFMDADSTGIEPLFALKTLKKLSGGGVIESDYDCVKQAINLLKISDISDEEIVNQNPELFATANDISWQAHIDMMAACQKHLNGSISKTVNLPSTCKVEDVEAAYIYAWKAGLKAVAIYRDGSKAIQPMNNASSKEKEEAPKQDSFWINPPSRLKPEQTRKALTHKINISGNEAYLTVGLYGDGSPCELFLRFSKAGSMISGVMDGFATSISLGLQYGVPLEKLIEKFKHTKFEPSGLTDNAKIPMTSSFMDYIAKWLELEFLVDKNDDDDDDDDDYEELEDSIMNLSAKDFTPEAHLDGESCPVCGSLTKIVGRCKLCSNCGFSGGCS